MSVGGSPGYGCDQESSGESGICDCLGCGIDRIASATEYIGQVLNDKLNPICDSIEDCTDKIYEELKERLEGPQYTCEQCNQMAQSGLAGTLEYAVRCAGQLCDECNAQCSLGENTEGKCCNYCGSPNCTCKNGECVPVESEPEPSEGFIGWCNPTSKLVVVTKKGEPGPGPGWISTNVLQSEGVAFSTAYNLCQQVPDPQTPTPPQKLPNYAHVSPFGCTLQQLYDGSILNQAKSAIDTFYSEGGAIQVAKAGSDIGAFGVTTGDVADVLIGLFRMAASQPAFYADVAATKVAPLVGCDNASFQAAMRLMGSFQMFTKQSGVDFSEFMLPYSYAMHAACRQKQSTPDQAMAAYLSNRIDRDRLENYWAINGICPEPLSEAIHASKSKPIPLQLAMMRRRKLIGDSDYHAGMRQLGYLEQPVAENLFKLTEQIPTLTDITRLMVRDADDESIPHWKESDRIFKLKYGKQLREWAEFQGIPEQFAKLYWRAHWNIPAPGQLFQFYHRLRNKPEFNKDRSLLDDIKAALIQQDILPFWQEHFLAVSFKPLTRIDVRRAYDIGAIDRASVLQSYSDLGYSDENADALTEFSTRLRDEKISGRKEIKLWLRFSIDRGEAVRRMAAMGLPADAVEQALDDESIKFISSPYSAAFVRGDLSQDSFAAKLDAHGVKLNYIQKIVELLSVKIRQHVAIDRYIVGTVERTEASDQMRQSGIMPEVASKLLDDADSAVELSFVKACQNGIKRRFLLGELTKLEAINELLNRKTVNSRANSMVDWWGCELKAGERQVSASTLCGWLAQGAITAKDFQSRLKKIGYSDIDSALMLEDCLQGISMKRLEQAKREAKEQAAEQSRTARLIEKQFKTVEQINVRMAKAREQGKKKQLVREKQLLAAAEKITDKGEFSLHSVLTMLKDEKSRLQRDYGLDLDQALQIMLVAAEEFAGPLLADYSLITSAMSAMAVASDLANDSPNGVATPSTNGVTHPSG